MADHTKIEWSQATWNIVTGCTRVSDGCDHCYIERTPPFRMAGRRFDKPGIGGSTGVVLHPDRLTLPLKWRKPRRIFVNSLSDLFHDDIPDGLVAAVWLVMGQCAGCIPEQYRGHTFQILTKRPARMRAFLRRWADTGDSAIPPMDPAAARCGRAQLVEEAAEYLGGVMTYDWMDGPRYWPTALPGVWLGVSVENQRWADIRIPALLDTPAAVRWLSCEPLLGPIELPFVSEVNTCTCYGGSLPGIGHEPGCGTEPGPAWGNLSWVVAGGESGPGSRPMHPDWARSLRDQCVDAGVPFFFKQWGDWCHSDQMPEDTWSWLDSAINLGQEPHPEPHRVGKKRAGRLLDGRTWDEYPGGTHG